MLGVSKSQWNFHLTKKCKSEQFHENFLFFRNVVLEDYYYESLLDENMDDFDEDAYLERLGRINEI